MSGQARNALRCNVGLPTMSRRSREWMGKEGMMHIGAVESVQCVENTFYLVRYSELRTRAVSAVVQEERRARTGSAHGRPSRS